jgi:hypothetical protein
MDATASNISKRYFNLLDAIAGGKNAPGFCLGPSAGDDGVPGVLRGDPATNLGPCLGDDAAPAAPMTLLGPCVGDDIVLAPTTLLGPCVGDDIQPPR